MHVILMIQDTVFIIYSDWSDIELTMCYCDNFTVILLLNDNVIRIVINSDISTYVRNSN